MTSFLPHFREPAHRSLLVAFLIILTLSGMDSVAMADDLQAVSAPPTVMAQNTGFDPSMTREVLGVALNFMAPRTLEAHSVREFCLWGLDGLTAIDPGLSVTETPARQEGDHHTPEMLVLQGQTVLLQRPVPAENDRTAWAALVTSAMMTAWDSSAVIRQAGGGALLQSFFDELFNHLDPYSRYLGPAPASADRTRRTGDTGSVGLTLAQEGHSIIVAAVNANGPAWEAGVNSGQRLVAVNGKHTRGQGVTTVQSWLNGDEHSPVSLELADRGRQPAILKMQRALVPPETVFASTEGQVTVLRVASFSTETAEEISQYLDQAVQGDTSDDLTSTGHSAISGKRPAGVIIDLRGDRGGVLQQAVTTAALMLDHGVAVTTHGRNAQANHIWAVQGGDITKGAPIVILVDGRTASAAEILAAALADHRRAVVVGSETLGKGLVQVIGQMPNGGELFVTWSRNQAPLGWPIQGLGIMPQVCTSRGKDYLDAQMAALKSGSALQTDAVRQARSARYPVSVAQILSIRKECPAAVGGDADMETAHRLLASPAAYKAALEAVPDENSAPLH
ncbi:peptidase S41 [Gluconobacter wancherniae]|uniref:S41 family peptidase n=1 Tax=Gluconobacter wancherniae TaxID=1307955 RepID=UPI001B8C0F77|nr:S41 family peptidase [Gluconobacter wancherniae]MBS1062768.1 peptidase S41 [Gluconobacter wancherniae]